MLNQEECWISCASLILSAGPFCWLNEKVSINEINIAFQFSYTPKITQNQKKKLLNGLYKMLQVISKEINQRVEVFQIWIHI